MEYCIYNYLYFERCSVSANEMVNSTKKLFSSKKSSFPLRGKSTANLLICVYVMRLVWNALWCSWLRYRVTSLTCLSFDSRWDNWDFFLLNPSGHTMALRLTLPLTYIWVESSWNMMGHGDAREGRWRENWRMELVASTIHTTSELGVSSITTADAHTSAASSRLNWRPCRFKWTRPFHRKTKSGFGTCAITFQTQSTRYMSWGVKAAGS